MTLPPAPLPPAAPVTGESRYRFSVIVPLESPRGQVEACLRGWTREQTFARDRYEVLAVWCPLSPPPQVTAIGSLLARPDRLLVHDQPHDIALAARGAQEARGELLFFTESHVLPAPETLKRADEAVHARAGIAGLSCRSVGLTQNRLGAAEAAMYEDAIRYGLEQHPWRRILDQCYIAWREPYFEAGGFRPEFGHFSEWLLAARMYRLGHRIGYAPEVELRHQYSGSIGELIEFAEDFALGEVRYHAEAGDDPCRSLFDEVPEWFGRHQWRADLARAAWSLGFREWTRARGSADRKWTVAWLRFLLVAASRAALGLRPALGRARLRLAAARAELPCRLLLAAGEAPRRNGVVRLNDAAVHRARLRFVARWLASRPPRASTPTLDPLLESRVASPWDAARADGFPSLGFHPVERWHGQPYRWSEPVAILEAPLAAGAHELSIEWLPLRGSPDLRIYVNGEAQQVTLGWDRAVARFRQASPGWARFAWVCSPWSARGDDRLLGLPVHRVAWTARPSRDPA
jgi:hypothetical protein